MSKVKNVKKYILCIIIVFALLFAGYHTYCHYMVSKFYKLVDEGDSGKIIACIEKMPDVNMMDVCMPFYYVRRIMLQGALDKGYPIYYAVWKQSDTSVLEALLEKGADLNKKDYDMPLSCLLRYEQEDMYEKVKLFVEYGADTNTEFVRIPGYWKQLTEIEKEERINTIIYLWECGIDGREHVGTKFERTILHDAAEFMDIQYLQILYNNEKRSLRDLLNEKDADGETPLFYAVRVNNFENCEFLIHEGSDTGIKNNEGKTAYDIAVELGCEDCIEILNHGKEKKIILAEGFEIEYKLTNREITEEELADINLGDSMHEITSKLGEPDAWIGSGILRPVYFLGDNKVVVFHFKCPAVCEDLKQVVLISENGESRIIKE